MGKLALLFVMVAVLGGSLLTFRTRMNANETDNERRDVQGDLLARDAATSGHSLVLNAMVGTHGFQSSLGFTERDVRDGRFTVDDYIVSPGGATANISVTGHSGGATHTIRSTYEWDPMDFPGPIWLDVPYATADVDPDVNIDGGPEALPVHFDDRRYNELELDPLLPWSTMASNLSDEFRAANGAGGDFLASNMETAGYLNDLNVADAGELYSAGINAMNAGDVLVPGPHEYNGETQNFGASPRIVRVTGDLRIVDAVVIGTGLLIIEGALEMEGTSPVLRWDGIVLIHSEANYLPISMGGAAEVDITGALVIDHVAVPPGGHMDLTINREDDGEWSSPEGITNVYWDSSHPWYQHTHRFDMKLPEERTVYFAEDGSDRHEEYTQFRDALNNLGSTPIYLEFYNPEMHGHASYTLAIDGQPQVYFGSVQYGFGIFSEDGNSFRTQAFNPNDLETLIVDVLSLRKLMKASDSEAGCPSGPKCVGRDWERFGALVVRIRRESDDKIFYEASLYWHTREDEADQAEQEEEELRALIESGGLFGTNLQLGPNVRIFFDLGTITAIGNRLGFDEDEYINRGSWAEHVTAREYRAQGIDAGLGGGPSAGDPLGGPPAAPLVIVCHFRVTIPVAEVSVPLHLSHGDTMGACP